MNDPEYVSGNPSVSKMWPLFVGFVLRLPIHITLLIDRIEECEDEKMIFFVSFILACDLIVVIASYFMYINDDQTSCFAGAKPAYPRE